MHITMSTNVPKRVAKEKMCYNVYGQILNHPGYIEELRTIRGRCPIFAYSHHSFENTAVDIGFNGFNIIAAILDQALARVVSRPILKVYVPLRLASYGVDCASMGFAQTLHCRGGGHV